jgi:tetratricopeptide (TPR) repeat protein
MKKTKFKKLITKGEIAGERKDYKTALACFDEAVLISGAQRRWDNFVEALGHKIVIDKHFWQTTKDKGFLELMRGDIELGLKLSKMKKLPSRYLAVFQLRMGDILLQEKKFKESVPWFRQALKSLARTPKNAGYSEYLRHLGEGLILAGKEKEAKRNLRRSLRLLQKDRNVRPFHRSNLELAVIAWLALAVRKKDFKESKELFNQATSMARKLRDKYKMPMRLKQLELMKKEFGL